MKTFLFSTILLCSLTGAAQYHPHCSQDRARTVLVPFPDSIAYEGTVMHQGERTIYIRDQKNGDSVRVMKGSLLQARFMANGLMPLPPYYTEYNEQGLLSRRDSLGKGPKGKHQNYFGLFECNHVYFSESYDSKGRIASCTWYAASGKDSVVRQWDSTGILRRLDNYTVNKQFPDGVRHTRLYYPSGILQSTSCYCEGKPCFIWIEYTEQGIQKRKISHTMPARKQTNAVYEALTEEPPVFIMVEQHSDFPGGQYALKKYFEQKLDRLLYDDSSVINGRYELRFRIDEEGRAVFLDIKGVNVGALKNDLQYVIGQMPRWAVAKRNGRPVCEDYMLRIKLRETSR